MHPDAARALYDRITSLDEFERSLQIEPNTPGRDEIIARVVEALQDCTIDDGGRLYRAPSPWHAFFVLWERHAYARRRGSAAFFRGHNVVGLPSVQASIYRKDTSAELARQARLAVEILVQMLGMSEIISSKGDDHTALARTIAQHYGIRTSLLDVTLDPSVAIFFASTGGRGDEGAVLVFDWEHCEAMQLRVVLPPVSPWSRRLTTQRGCFLDFEGIFGLDIDDVPFEVQFSRMPGFEVRRTGNVYVPWPIEEPAATDLIAWVGTMAANNTRISQEITSQIEARSETRVLLKHQFELIFGFAPDASFAAAELRERAEQAIWKYMVAGITELETYINHLCLKSGCLSAERVIYLQESNRALFDQYADQVSRLRREARLLDPQYTELLRILNREESGSVGSS